MLKAKPEVDVDAGLREYARWKEALADERLPAALVDLDAVDDNLRTLLGGLSTSSMTLRVASKSLRHPALMRYLIDQGRGRVAGVMTYSAHEMVFLAEQGFDDMLMGYPFAREDEASAAAGLAERGVRAICTVDAPRQVALLDRAARARGVVIPVCIDIDVSWRPLKGKLHFGVRRSPIRSAGQARDLARVIADARGVELVALLAYEAQVAGLRDKNPGSRYLDPVRKAIKARSVPLAEERRAEVLEALASDGHHVEVVNGGGSGSVETTGRDPSVTEVTAGSGFVCSHLFDGYEGLPFRPAVFFALSVVRHSDPDHLTCAGGGYVASGPPALDRQPAVHLPPGLEPLPMEGFGEVQTPFRVRDPRRMLRIGEPVICRHAKAGELAERFAEYLFYRKGRIETREPTYRGFGQCFM